MPMAMTYLLRRSWYSPPIHGGPGRYPYADEYRGTRAEPLHHVDAAGARRVSWRALRRRGDCGV